MMQRILASVLSLASVGCAANFSRAEMTEKLWDGEKVFTDFDVAKIEQLRPQLPPQFRLAIAPPLREDWRGPRLSVEARAEFVSWFEPLQNTGVVGDVVVLPRLLMGPASGRTGSGADYYKAVRVAAARVQADAVLIMSSVTEVDGYINPWSILYLTGIGACFAPGTTREALTIVEGVVIDTRNEYVYWTGIAEGLGKTTAPVVGIDEDDAVNEARFKAFQSLAGLLAKEANRLKAGPPGPRYGTPGK